MTNKMAQQLGKLGGKATAKKYGAEHFSNAGRIGMAKRWAGHIKKTPEGNIVIKFACPACGQEFETKQKYLKDVGNCPKCDLLLDNNKRLL
jgi:peptide subunit release factor 1 (eRF1)